MKNEQRVKQYLFVIRQLNKKENKKLNTETHFGTLWNVANPLLFMIVMSSLYGTIFKHDIENFQIYFFTGFIIYSFYRSATLTAMTSLVSNKNFLLQTKIPMGIFITERVYTALINMFYSFIAFVFLFIYYKMHLYVSVLWIIPIVAITFIIALGLGKILAVIYVFFADIDYLYSVFMTLVLFSSAIFYPVERLNSGLQIVVGWNPVYISITLVRNAVMYGRLSSGVLWIKLIIWAIISYSFGTWLFNRKKNDILQKL